MTSISIGTFRGELPRIDDRLLPDTQASYAENCSFDHGNLEPMDGLSSVAASLKSGTETIYRYRSGSDYWFSWTSEVNAVDSPVPLDQYQRCYFTGLDVPRFTHNGIATGGSLPNGTIKLGIPAPTSAPSAVNNDGQSDGDPYNDETAFYVYTWVSALGEEGPPSPVSNQITIPRPASVDVTLTLPALAVNDRNISSRRIYRAASTGADADYFLVAELSVGTLTYHDTTYTVALGSALVSTGYYPPPDDLKGLTALANGVLIGFSGNTLCPSEPSLPYAFDPSNQLACDSNIVAIGQLPTGAVIATEGQPYILTGYTPDSYSLVKLETTAPCVSSRSMVDMGQFVVYASGEGLVACGNGEPEIITRDSVTKKQWQNLNPSSIHAYHLDGKYIGFFNNGTPMGFIFDLVARDFVFIDTYADAGFHAGDTERLYLSINDNLYILDNNSGSPRTFDWYSKEFLTPPVVMRACKLRGSNVTFRLIRDDVTVATQVISTPGEHVFRLPKGRGARWRIRLEGNGYVESVQIAQAVKELV